MSGFELAAMLSLNAAATLAFGGVATWAMLRLARALGWFDVRRPPAER